MLFHSRSQGLFGFTHADALLTSHTGYMLSNWYNATYILLLSRKEFLDVQFLLRCLSCSHEGSRRLLTHLIVFLPQLNLEEWMGHHCKAQIWLIIYWSHEGIFLRCQHLVILKLWVVISVAKGMGLLTWISRSISLSKSSLKEHFLHLKVVVSVTCMLYHIVIYYNEI